MERVEPEAAPATFLPTSNHSLHVKHGTTAYKAVKDPFEVKKVLELYKWRQKTQTLKDLLMDLLESKTRKKAFYILVSNPAHKTFGPFDILIILIIFNIDPFLVWNT